MRKILYSAPVVLDDQVYERDVLINELLTRLQITFAGYQGLFNPLDSAGNLNTIPSSYGIVAANNPTRVPIDLAVFVDPSVTTTVDINPGTAVFQTGEIIVIESTITRVALADSSINTQNIVYLQFDELETTKRLTRYSTSANTIVEYLLDPKDYVKVVTLTNYLAFSASELSTKIPLAVVTVNGDGTLSVDSSRSALETNRPWFSPVDIAHRSYLGTGKVTEANIHGLSLNDLAATSGKTLFQLLSGAGMVIARDEAYARIPGHYCVDTIPADLVKEDSTGSVTGIAGAYYCYLTKFPTKILRATVSTPAAPTTDGIADLAAICIPKRNLVVFLATDAGLFIATVKQAVKIEYLAVSVLAPVLEPIITSPMIFSPRFSTDETVIAGGLSVTESPLQLDFGDAGTFPMIYSAFLQGDGFIYKRPQCIFCSIKVDTAGTATQQASIKMLGPSKLRVGLTGASGGATLKLSVLLSGLNSTGANITETVVFDNTGSGTPATAWVQDLTPGGAGSDNENTIIASKMYKFTSQTFYSLKSFQITVVPTGTGPSAVLGIWAELSDVTCEPISDSLPLADFIWDGVKVAPDAGANARIEDVRNILTDIKEPFAATPRYDFPRVFSAAQTTLGEIPWQLVLEDFNKPNWLASEYKQVSPIFNPLVPDVPSFSKSNISKMKTGLDRRDQYLSRAIPVRPSSTRVAKHIRFYPVQNGARVTDPKLIGFSFWARVFGGTIGWSSWYSATPSNYSFDNPSPGLTSLALMEIDLTQVKLGSGSRVSLSSINQLVKFQVACQGPVKSFATMIFLDGDASFTSPGFDSGIWNNEYIQTISGDT